MKAVVYKGKHKVAVEDVSDPKIQHPADAIIKITTTGICGSDLHMYEERSTAKPGCVFGHENMGIVEETGPGVMSIKKGDRVVLPFNIGCGICFNCTRGFTSACLTVNPKQPGAGYEYAGMGPFRGGQAEYLRVPFVDFNALKLPGKPQDELEDDFLLLSDIFPTGWFGAELAQVQTGSSVAIFGSGPVGLLAAMSSMIKGAAEVYVVDRSEERLKRAKSIGATPVNFTKGDPVEQIYALRASNKQLQQALRPEEKKMKGVMCAIDTVGYQAHSGQKPSQEDPMQTFKWIAKVINPTGTVGSVGVYFEEDPVGVDSNASKGIFEMPLGELWGKGVQLGMGQTPVKKFIPFLRDLIIAGKANPSFIVSHRIPLEEAPDAYEKFDHRGIGVGKEYTKVLIKPGMKKAA